MNNDANMESKEKMDDVRLGMLIVSASWSFWERQEIETEIERARAAEARLEKENAELQKSNDEGYEKYRAMEKENAALKKRIEALEFQVKDAQAAYDIEQKMRIMDAKEYRNGK